MPPTYTPLVKVNEKVLFNYSDTDLENLYKFKFISKEAYDKEMNFRKKEREKTPKFRLFKDKLKVDTEHNQLLTTKRQPAKKKEPEVVESSSADEDAPAKQTKKQPVVINASPPQIIGNIDPSFNNIWLPNETVEMFNHRRVSYFAGLTENDLKNMSDFDLNELTKSRVISKDWFNSEMEDRKKGRANSPFYKIFQNRFQKQPKEMVDRYKQEWGNRTMPKPFPTILGKTNYNGMFTGQRFPGEKALDLQKRYNDYGNRLQFEDLKYFSDNDIKNAPIMNHFPQEMRDKELKFREETRKINPFFRKYADTLYTWTKEENNKLIDDYHYEIRKQSAEQFLSQLKAGKKFKVVKGSVKTITPADRIRQLSKQVKSLKKKPVQTQSLDSNEPHFVDLMKKESKIERREMFTTDDDKYEIIPYKWNGESMPDYEGKIYKAKVKSTGAMGYVMKYNDGSTVFSTHLNYLEKKRSPWSNTEVRPNVPSDYSLQVNRPKPTDEDPRPQENIPVVSTPTPPVSVPESEAESDFIPNADEEDINPLDIGEQPYYIITPENEKDFEPEGKQAYDMIHRLERSQLVPAYYKPLANKHGLIKVYSDGTKVWSSSFSRLPSETQLKYERERAQQSAQAPAQVPVSPPSNTPPPEDPRPRENIPVIQQAPDSQSPFKLSAIPGAQYEIVKDGKKDLRIVPDSRNHKVPEDKNDSWKDLIMATYKGQLGFAVQLKDGTVVWSKKIQDIPVLSKNRPYFHGTRMYYRNPPLPDPEQPPPPENKLIALPGAQYEIVKDGKKDLRIVPDSRNHKVPEDKSDSWNDLIIAKYKGQLGFVAQLKDGTVVWSKKIQDLPILTKYHVAKATFDNQISEETKNKNSSEFIRLPKSEMLKMKFNSDDPQFESGYFPVTYWRDGKAMYGYLERDSHNADKWLIFRPWDKPKKPLNTLDEAFIHKAYRSVHEPYEKMIKLKGKIDAVNKMIADKEAMFESDIRDRINKLGMPPENIFDLAEVQLLPQTKYKDEDKVRFTPAVYKGKKGYLYYDPGAPQNESIFKWHINPVANKYNSKEAHDTLIDAVKKRHEITGTEYMMLPPGAEGTPSENAKKAAETNVNVNVNVGPKEIGVGTGSEPPPSGPVSVGTNTPPQKVDAGTDASTHTVNVGTSPDEPEPKEFEPNIPGNHGKPKIVEYVDEEGNLVGKAEMRYSTYGRPYIHKYHKYKNGKYIGTTSFNPPEDLDKDVPLKEKILKSTENTFKGYWDIAYDPKTHGEQARKNVGAVADAIANASMNLQGPDTYGYVAGSAASGLIATGMPVLQGAGALLGLGGLGYQIYRSKKIAKQLKKAERAQLLNEARAATWQNTNAMQAMNSLRTTLKMQNKQKQVARFRGIYEQASTRNRLGAMKEMIRMMNANEKEETANRQDSIYTKARENYMWGLKRQEEASKKAAEEANNAILELKKQPLHYLRDIFKGTQYEGPLNQMIYYQEHVSPNPHPEEIAESLYDYRALAADRQMDYLVQDDNQFSRKDGATLGDYDYFDLLSNEQAYLDAMAREGPTWLMHKDYFDAYVARSQKDTAVWNGIKQMIETGIASAYEYGRPFLVDKVGGFIKFADAAIDAMRKDPNIRQEYKEDIEKKIRTEAEIRERERQRIIKMLDDKKKANDLQVDDLEKQLDLAKARQRELAMENDFLKTDAQNREDLFHYFGYRVTSFHYISARCRQSNFIIALDTFDTHHPHTCHVVNIDRSRFFEYHMQIVVHKDFVVAGCQAFDRRFFPDNNYIRHFR